MCSAVLHVIGVPKNRRSSVCASQLVIRLGDDGNFSRWVPVGGHRSLGNALGGHIGTVASWVSSVSACHGVSSSAWPHVSHLGASLWSKRQMEPKEMLPLFQVSLPSVLSEDGKLIGVRVSGFDRKVLL